MRPTISVVFQVSASTAEDMAAGREVKFTGLIQDFEWANQHPLLRLEVKDIEQRGRFPPGGRDARSALFRSGLPLHQL